MTTSDDSTPRPGDPDPLGRSDDPTTEGVTTDVDDEVLVVQEPAGGGGSAAPGLALAGLLAGIIALFTAAGEAAVRECTPSPLGETAATGADGFLTALVLALVAVLLSAIGAATSRTDRWGLPVGVAGIVVGLVTVVLWLLTVFAFGADPVDVDQIATQQQALLLQGFGCA
ncbi:hypothetical protein [Pseudokineococcus sp. 1T1Z-3]|uniref:hypothetical protein n=1 Tax=Pseudokineococcus sp. 1T1Z-3 TaxID=3132745 RepID=UPI0030B6529E